MEIEKTLIDGVLLIKPKIFGDHRGFFVETWHEKRYAEAGITLPFIQDNFSMSTKGILRGMHFQKKFPQGKLVRASLGEVFDVVVDGRKNSPSFGKWYGATLTGENQHQLWIPPGLIHGFLVLSDIAHFQYKCTELYKPEDEGALLWNDPTVGIEWPMDSPVVSEKDAKAPLWKQALDY